ncbi:putative cystathionine gamma-lyase 2 isoform X2 [Coccinella septempunctata]|uniref:putative cystathionine gamma-lyase 2 isoform X2 n=1 Tax=Coccinella septempunctata TaxID=41139 RepID=UPI001D06A238|nr:putative cystathionine gamma-lyase 2 isoform X2 [Coccinella septempunctata]
MENVTLLSKLPIMSGDSFLPLQEEFATLAIHEAQEPEQWSCMEVVTPLSTSTTFKQNGPADFKKYEYSRSGNPTREVLEKVIAKLEDGKHGFCFSSGLGANTTLLGLLKSGDHILCINDVYGGTNRLFTKVASRFGIETSFSEIEADSFEKNLRKNTKMIWIETPTNPTLQVCDIQRVADISKKNNVILVVDNTFLTPYFQKPLMLGADIVVHSITKYMNGHSDVVMGAVVCSNEELSKEIKFLQNAMGTVPSPFDCYQVLRSLKTLALRMKQHSESSLHIAKYLESHPKVEKVIHPGLSNHPQYELTKRQTSGHSGMLSFYIKGDIDSSKKFLQSLKIFTLAESLGGYESLAELPAVMTHSSVPADQRERLRITDNLIRLSVGLEDVGSLVADLEQALAAI